MAVSAREIMEVIPDDAPVSAHYALTPHLARRTHVYSWPNPFSRSMYGTDINLEGMRLPESDLIEYVVLQVPLTEEVAAVWTTVAADFVEEERNDHWVVYRRVTAASAMLEGDRAREG